MSKSYGKLEPGPNIHPTAEVFDSSFGAYTKIGAYSRIENAVYGDMSYSEAYVYVANARIGKYSNIAASVRIGPTAHPYHRPTLHHFTYRSDSYGWTEEREEAFFKERESRLAFIGHDTWIGHGAVIMPEVTLGHGSVVGAGAVATKDVPPYAIVGGVPARIMNYRFSLNVAEALLEIAWWDWPLETVRDRLEDFRGDTLAFVEKYSGS